tara:strand:+ start:1404 stop:1931 length:528 start_codon:yes stop_codon:yes gene_type:complete
MPRSTSTALTPVFLPARPALTQRDAATQTHVPPSLLDRVAAARRRRSPVMVDQLATRVLRACRSDDEGTRLLYVGRSARKETVLKLRAGATSTAAALQARLAALLPLAEVQTSRNVLDGSAYAHVTLPPPDREWALAHAHVARHAALRALRWVGVCLWTVALATLFYHDSAKDEL